MSMALVLRFTRDWLREKNGWDHTQCGVQAMAEPPYEAASPFYIGLEDGGVEPGNELTDSLKETLSITIGIWRKPEHLGHDLAAGLTLPQDQYLLGSLSLYEIERAIIVHKSFTGSVKNGLHGNYQFVQDLNAAYNLPDESLGAGFIGCWKFRGRGGVEPLGREDGQAWIGFKLRFRGVWREQKQRLINDTIG